MLRSWQALPTAVAEQGYRERSAVCSFSRPEPGKAADLWATVLCPPETLPNTSLHGACLAPTQLSTHSILAPTSQRPQPSCWLFPTLIPVLASPRKTSSVWHKDAPRGSTAQLTSSRHPGQKQRTCHTCSPPAFCSIALAKPSSCQQLLHPSRTPSPWLRRSGAPAKARMSICSKMLGPRPTSSASECRAAREGGGFSGHEISGKMLTCLWELTPYTRLSCPKLVPFFPPSPILLLFLGTFFPLSPCP